MEYSRRTTRSFVIALLALCGCDLGTSPGSDPRLDSSADGRYFTYALNQSFSLEVDVHTDAGYGWYCAVSDTTVIHLDSTSYRPKSGNWNMNGGMTVETFYFRTTRMGLCTINLAERRGWLPDVAPINMMEFTVIVHD